MTHEDALLNCNNLNFNGFTFCLIFYFVTATRTSKESHRHFLDICLCTVVGENVMHLIHFRVHYICVLRKFKVQTDITSNVTCNIQLIQNNIKQIKRINNILEYDFNERY